MESTDMRSILEWDPQDRARFFRSVDDESAGGCWLWTGQVNAGGYGRLRRGGRGGQRVMAHRYIYERTVGPIPEGMQLDHLYRVRHCVNPDHLEPVTARENVLRGAGVAAAFASRTECSHGHPLTEANVLLRRDPNGRLYRRCRTCRLAEQRGNRSRRMARVS